MAQDLIQFMLQRLDLLLNVRGLSELLWGQVNEVHVSCIVEKLERMSSRTNQASRSF